MKKFKLMIDLLPKGAWGQDLSRTLAKQDWDLLRQNCYERYKNKCAICGAQSEKLNAHEEWEFDIKNKTQTLKNIIALCPKCHGVKHMRNSERLGFGENAKQHFLKINNTTEMEFAKHYTQAQFLFEERNKIFRWKIIADLSKFTSKFIDYKQKNIPMIKSVYNNEELEIIKNNISYNPRVISLEIDNYAGLIKVICGKVNKIEWFNNGELICKKFNFTQKLKSNFSVENLTGNVFFKISNNMGEFVSKIFYLESVDFEK